jgi:hypothetical protein
VTAFLLWPLAVLELAPRILHHALTTLTYRRST